MTDGAEQDAGAATPEAAEPAVNGAAEPSIKEQVLEQMGGWQGMVYSTLPVVVFVPVNWLFGLGWGAGAALAAALVVLVIRLVTRTSVQPAISGFIGVAVCVGIALLLGGRWFFLYGIVSQAVFALAFAVSTVVGRPLVGVLWHFFQSADDEVRDWRADRRARRVYTWLTVAWALAFGVRFVIQGALFLQDNVNGLGVARLIMGVPMFAVLLVLTFWAARRVETPRADSADLPAKTEEN